MEKDEQHDHKQIRFGRLVNIEDQKLIILSMALLEFDDSPKSKHHDMLKTIRESLAEYLP